MTETKTKAVPKAVVKKHAAALAAAANTGKPLTKTQARSIGTSLLGYFPVDMLLDLAVDLALATIKGGGQKAILAQKALTKAAQGVERKWPGTVCPK